MASAGAHEHGAVGVTVKGHAQRGVRFDHFLLKIFRMERAAAVVNISSVGLVVDRNHFGAERAEQRWPQLARGAIGAVEHDSHPREFRSEENTSELQSIAY